MKLYANNNIHHILLNNVQVMETEQAFSIHSVLLLYIKNFTVCWMFNQCSGVGVATLGFSCHEFFCLSHSETLQVHVHAHTHTCTQVLLLCYLVAKSVLMKHEHKLLSRMWSFFQLLPWRLKQIFLQNIYGPM
jgi:hypothetical protein